ncbi:hypothetical protein [Streptomyces sp. YIM 130001]|nr:hypothetical protein [Streptomyces sp. YIM 130001]
MLLRRSSLRASAGGGDGEEAGIDAQDVCEGVQGRSQLSEA